MKKQILQQLVDKEVMIQAAVENGIRIGDEQLAALIRDIDAFQTEGRFDAAKYERVLAQQGMSPRLFEQRVRRDLLANQFTAAVVEGEFVLPAEVDALLQLQLQQRDIGYMVLPVSKYEAGIAISDEQLQNHYQENSARYMEPEQVKVDYLELNADTLAAEIPVSDEELRQRYEAQKLNFRTAEERQARHILLQLAADASAQEVEAARLKATSLLERIRAGEDFATVAKAESQDPGSARNGGDLGFFGMGVMDKAFEEAAFSLQEGELSEPVRSAFGYHIIKLEAIKGGETKPFEAVAEQLKHEIQQERAAEIFYDRAERLANLTYEQPDTLTVAAEQLQLTIQHSDYFTRSGGAGIAANPKVASVAFSEDVLLRGNNSETIELDDNHLLVLRVSDHKPEAIRPFEEVKQEIEANLVREQAQKQARQEAETVLKQVQGGANPQTVASELQVEWLRQQGVLRDNTELNRAIVAAVFRLPRPEQGSASYELMALPGGDQALIALFGVTPGDSAGAEETVRQDAAARIRRAATNAAEEAMITALRERAEITVRQ